MNLQSALKEIGDMLSIAADAAQSLTRQHSTAFDGGAEARRLLEEVTEIAERLRQIGDEIAKV